jgi:hypothetical protein
LAEQVLVPRARRDQQSLPVDPGHDADESRRFCFAAEELDAAVGEPGDGVVERRVDASWG